MDQISRTVAGHVKNVGTFLTDIGTKIESDSGKIGNAYSEHEKAEELSKSVSPPNPPLNLKKDTRPGPVEVASTTKTGNVVPQNRMLVTPYAVQVRSLSQPWPNNSHSHAWSYYPPRQPWSHHSHPQPWSHYPPPQPQFYYSHSHPWTHDLHPGGVQNFSNHGQQYGHLTQEGDWGDFSLLKPFAQKRHEAAKENLEKAKENYKEHIQNIQAHDYAIQKHNSDYKQVLANMKATKIARIASRLFNTSNGHKHLINGLSKTMNDDKQKRDFAKNNLPLAKSALEAEKPNKKAIKNALKKAQRQFQKAERKFNKHIIQTKFKFGIYNYTGLYVSNNSF